MSAIPKQEPNLKLVKTRPDATDQADDILLDMLFEYHQKRLNSPDNKTQ